MLGRWIGFLGPENVGLDEVWMNVGSSVRRQDLSSDAVVPVLVGRCGGTIRLVSQFLPKAFDLYNHVRISPISN
jgi:hypothetical protein